MVAERVAEWQGAGERRWRPSLALEQRAGVELAELIASPVYYGLGVPRGDGRTVLLIPGFMGSDSYLTILGGWLRRIGYRPAQSGISFNAGSISRQLRQVERRCEELTARDGKITLIGHSLGGIFARVMAVTRPDLIEDVIALGSPLVGNPRDAAHPIVRALGEALLMDDPRDESEAMLQLGSPLPDEVRLTSIYSREDAVVDYRSCLDTDPNAACYEVRGTHVGLAWNAAVYRLLGRVLAN
jgi:pimeloyl-ACP methyl ester carboxylesterase